MSSITVQQRPGVYSSYEASALTVGSRRGKTVAVVAEATADADETYYRWNSYSKAAADVGECTLSRLAQLALRNGAGVVYGIPVKSDDYTTAFATAAALEDVAVVVCDSTETTVQQALRTMVDGCSEERKERIAVVAGAANESTADLIERAETLNDERVVLVAPGAVNASGTAQGGVECAAALAGAIAGTADPALPLGGAQLYGLEGLETVYDDDDIDDLILGGVTPLEVLAGGCYVVRAVTTRTTTGGVADTTWMELTTILVVDEVIPGIRNSLRARFSRAKNTEQTRGAIRSQVIMELEDRVSREIIDSYEDVTAEPLSSDPTVCLVEFAFTVAHGLNQIWLSAHITV